VRYGIISDIHGNLEALQAVLEQIERENVDQYVCLGDIVGYGANPNECVNIVRSLTDKVVVGNHDHAAVGLVDLRYFNRYAREAAIWTAGVLTQENRDYLRSLPFKISENDILFVHSTPSRPEKWRYLFLDYDVELQMRWYEEKLCFIGHSHQPLVFVKEDDEIPEAFRLPISVKDDARYVVNVGSVGQPRDSDPRAAYVIADLESGLIDLKRVPYDVEIAQRKIIRAGLPAFLAERLGVGE